MPKPISFNLRRIWPVQQNSAPSRSHVRLQVMLCTFGPDGLRKIVECRHPELPGVEYVVCWQLPDTTFEAQIPEEIRSRSDFRILRHNSQGSAVNRTVAINAADAPAALITDDDVVFTPERLEGIINAFDSHPEADIISFRYESDCFVKPYPDYEFDMRRRPREFYISAIEIAVRPERVAGRLAFNPRFGINSEFSSGEEDIFLLDAVKYGFKWIFVPFTICLHPGLSTGSRQDPDYLLVLAKGAIFTRLEPLLWSLRMITHSIRNAGLNHKYRSRRKYLKTWLCGVKLASAIGAFNESPAYASFYEEIYTAKIRKLL